MFSGGVRPVLKEQRYSSSYLWLYMASPSARGPNVLPGSGAGNGLSFQIIAVAHTQAVHRKPRGNSARKLEEGNGDTGRGDGRVLHAMDRQRRSITARQAQIPGEQFGAILQVVVVAEPLRQATSRRWQSLFNP